MKPRKTINQNIEKTRKDRVMRRKEEDVKKSFVDMFLKRYEVSSSFGNIDLAVFEKGNYENPVALFEAKKGNADLVEALAQLIITFNNAKNNTKNNNLNINYPKFMGAFNESQVLIVKTSDILPIFSRDDIDWRMTPSRGYKNLINFVYEYSDKFIIFDYTDNNGRNEFRKFISDNFKTVTGFGKLNISTHNVLFVYKLWSKNVQPQIKINWKKYKNNENIDPLEFFISDLHYKCGIQKEWQNFIFDGEKYEINYRFGIFSKDPIGYVKFKDDGLKHRQFWDKYDIKEKDLELIIKNKYLLFDEDKRKRTGSFYTPIPLAKLAQQYLLHYLKDIQTDEIYIWDPAAGTGNLIIGIADTLGISHDRVFASTLEIDDVNAMQTNEELNIPKENIFQFDFLNDEFKPVSKGGKVPDKLYNIIKIERKKVIILMNPPFSEPSNIKTMTHGENFNLSGLLKNRVKDEFGHQAGKLSKDLFALFILRIINNFRGCKICTFSPLKLLTGHSSKIFIKNLNSKYLGGFLVDSKVFNNVKSSFPVLFSMWDTNISDSNQYYTVDVYNKKLQKIGYKVISFPNRDYIDVFRQKYIAEKSNKQAPMFALITRGISVSSNNHIRIDNLDVKTGDTKIFINKENFIEACVFFSVRLSVEESFINFRDPFYYPDDNFSEDKEFLGDCVVYALFHNKNIFKGERGKNYLIPYDLKNMIEKYKNRDDKLIDKFVYNLINNSDKLKISEEAKKVLEIGEKIYLEYHETLGSDINDSFYEIREYMKKNDEKMNKMYKEMKKYLKVLKSKILQKAIKYKFYIDNFYPNTSES